MTVLVILAPHANLALQEHSLVNPMAFIIVSHAETVLKVCLYFLRILVFYLTFRMCNFLYIFIDICALLVQGLYIKRRCTTIQDTICDVLDGYHCIDYSNSQCRHAEKHSVCISGQETKKTGIVSNTSYNTILFSLPFSHDSVFRGIVHPKRFLFLENMLCVSLQGQNPQIQYVWTALMGFILRQV